MSVSMNRVIVAGNLTRDPDLRFTASGTAVCQFGLAVNKRGKEGKDSVTFLTIVAWQKTAELCGKYLAKGRSVLVEGRVDSRSYQTQAGEKRTVFEIVAESVQFLSPHKALGAPADGNHGGSDSDRGDPGDASSAGDDAAPFQGDIPF